MDVAPGFTLMVNQMPTPLSPPKAMVRSREKVRMALQPLQDLRCAVR